MNVITVARQIGCRGDWIAEQVATKLGYDLVDKRLVEEIAKIKMPDLNAKDLPGAMNIIEGTCKSMGIQVEG